MKVSVRIPVASLRQHVLVTGRSGSGKSKFMEVLAYELQRTQSSKKAAICIVDPHGDFAKAALSFARNQDRERLIYISSTINREAGITGLGYTACLNPFANNGSPDEIFILTEVLTEVLAELLSEAALSVQMLSLLRPAIATVLRSSEPSLATLNRMFLDSGNEDLIELGKTSDNIQHRQFFLNDWGSSDYSLTKRSIRSRLNYFLSNDVIANFLQGRSSFSLEKALDEGKVIICNFSQSASVFASQVMGKMFIAMVHAAMLKRDAKELHERKSAYVFIDEVQTMLSPVVASSLAQNRKYGLSMILGNQSVKAIDNTAIRKQIMVNTYLKCLSMTDHEDRTLFAREMGIEVADIETLEPLQFYLKRNSGKHRAFKFTVPILPRIAFLSKKQKKELLAWIVREQYIPIAPPPPPLPVPPSQPVTPIAKKKPPTDQQNNEGLRPAF